MAGDTAMSISLVSNQKIAETSSKGNQENRYHAGTGHKEDQGAPLCAEILSKQRLGVRHRLDSVHFEVAESFQGALQNDITRENNLMSTSATPKGHSRV